MKILPLLGFLLLTGCAAMTPEYKRVAMIHAGMTKAEVLANFGRPIKTVQNGSLEMLTYDLADTKPSLTNPNPLKTSHYIMISNGRVESFGKD